MKFYESMDDCTVSLTRFDQFTYLLEEQIANVLI